MKYRNLQVGERVRSFDEYQVNINNPDRSWLPVFATIGEIVRSGQESYFRRRVEYHFLGVGELIKLGDEFKWPGRIPEDWRAVCSVIGCIIEPHDYGSFRREVPPPKVVAPPTETELEIIAIKTLRRDIDTLLQRVKGLDDGNIINSDERTEAQKKLREAVMWLGLDLKRIAEETGTQDVGNPYPNSKDPSNTLIDKTADNLKL